MICRKTPFSEAKFELLEKNLSILGFTIQDKKSIYSVLSAILNLGNIEFETVHSSESCVIQIDSRKYLCNAAALLNLNETELEVILTNHIRDVGGQRIM